MPPSLLQQIRDRVAREIGPQFIPSNRRMAMIYPSPYRAGMSSLGFQWITTLLRDRGVGAERAFLPDDPAAYRAARQSPVTYETHTPIGKFPLLAVSLSYELEIAGLIELLDLAGIPPLREDRGPHDPVILLGGPITMANPLAAAPFVDAMLLGEAEATATSAVPHFFDAESYESWLDHVASLPGGFVPARHGTCTPIASKAPNDDLPARSSWISPDAELSSMFLIEGERGCHRECSFCVMRRGGNLGGMRLVKSPRVLDLVPDHARKVGLVGAAISDHPQLVEILETLVADGRQVSLSSLRADRVMARPQIARLLRQSGAKTITVASDGASERLRKTIIKKTKEKHLLAVAEQAAALRFVVYKVYMMIGLPGETAEDIDELIRFTKELAIAAKPARLALGVAPFVAKKHTPLDGEPFAGIKEVDRRMRQLTRGLRGLAEVRPVSSRWAWVEWEVSQGGPETGHAILEAWRNGGKFAHWKQALNRVDNATKRPWALL
ncbi:MAG: radical SAM protein [Rhodobacterales bacterium]|nr:radical SAM protein [Rhodobacterales bacterium]